MGDLGVTSDHRSFNNNRKFKPKFDIRLRQKPKVDGLEESVFTW